MHSNRNILFVSKIPPTFHVRDNSHTIVEQCQNQSLEFVFQGLETQTESRKSKSHTKPKTPRTLNQQACTQQHCIECIHAICTSEHMPRSVPNRTRQFPPHSSTEHHQSVAWKTSSSCPLVIGSISGLGSATGRCHQAID